MGAGEVGLNRAAVGLLLAGAVAAGGAGSAIVVQHRADAQRSHNLHTAQAALTQSLHTRIGRAAARAEQYANELPQLAATRPADMLAAAPHTDVTSLTITGPMLPLRVVAGARLPAALTGTGRYLQDAALVARDSAAPIAVVTRSGSSQYVVVLWPLYRTAVPADTQMRRSASAGWVVGSASIADFLAPVATAEHAFGATIAVRVTPAGPAAIATTLRGGLNVRVTSVPAPSRLGVLLLALLTVLACGGILGFTALIRRRDLDMARRQRALDEQVTLVTEISVTIQESLDVGVVLPAVLAQISQRLELLWIRIVVGPNDAGVELLAIGRRHSRLPAQRWSPDATTASAGQLVRLPLRRATRTLGHLELAPSAALDEYQVASLRQCTDLLAGALHNAELYEREHESVRRLRDLDALKDDFLGTVSHELRTPLSVLTGSVSLLTDAWERLPDESRRTTVAKMQPHVASLANLVNDLLDFISDRRAATTASLSQVQLDREIQQLAELLRPLVHRQDLQVVAPEPVTAWTDVRGLERIIGNLVSNAGKYSPEGTTIRVDVRQGPHDTTVSVCDEGPGIRPEDRERIFERFYRGDSQAARSTRGSGIGLAVAMTWMQAVGARLEVRTALGRGTTMAVHFPSSQGASVDGAGTVTWHTVEAAEEELVR